MSASEVEEVVHVLATQGIRQDETLKKQVIREVMQHYSSILYEAVEAEGTEEQQRAFKELWAYLYPIAYYKSGTQEHAEESTQSALVKIWEKSRQCKDPERFLGWSKVVLLNEVRMSYRTQSREKSITETDLRNDREEDVVEQVTTQSHKSINIRAIEDRITGYEKTQRLHEVLQSALRSENQQIVIEGLFFQGLEIGTLAKGLNTSPSNIYTLKSRALSRLRENQEFLHALDDLLSKGWH
jgi:RNA polymerase sigma factor (sigma-70 family)